MRILVVSQYFWPEDFRVNDLVSGLVSRGHTITVLTGLPNYPGGSFYNGYGWRGPWSQTYAGARVIRVPLTPRGGASAWRLALNYFSFALFGSCGALWRLHGPFDLVFVSEVSPITVGIPAIVARWRFRAPMMFWVLDLWPDTLAALGVVRSRRMLAAVGVLVRRIYAQCSRVLVQSRGFVPVVARYGVCEEDILYFPQWVETDYQKPNQGGPPVQPELPQGLRVMFAGNIGEAQDFPAIIEAAHLLKAADVSWVIVGDGRMATRTVEMVESRGLKHKVHFLGRHAAAAMPALFDAADALLVSLRPDPIFSLTVPGKLQSYLASGRPVLAMLDGEGARVVEEAQAGFVCAAGDARALAANVLKLAALSPGARDRLGANGRAYAQRHFDRERLFDQFEEWAETVVSEQSEAVGRGRSRFASAAGRHTDKARRT